MSVRDHTLPTVEQAREALAVINRGREAFGLPALDVLDYDSARPMDGCACLSYRALLGPITDGAGSVGGEAFYTRGYTEAKLLAEALGSDVDGEERVIIPASIRAVTDPFDGNVEGLRERLVEAGVVAGAVA